MVLLQLAGIGLGFTPRRALEKEISKRSFGAKDPDASVIFADKFFTRVDNGPAREFLLSRHSSTELNRVIHNIFQQPIRPSVSTSSELLPGTCTTFFVRIAKPDCSREHDSTRPASLGRQVHRTPIVMCSAPTEAKPSPR